MSDLKNKPVHPHEVWLKAMHPLLDGRYEKRPGMTLREYYAGLAMVGQIAAPALKDSSCAGIAKWSLAYADALVAELEKTDQ